MEAYHYLDVADGRCTRKWYFWVDPYETDEGVVTITLQPPPLTELPQVHIMKIANEDEKVAVTLVVATKIQNVLDNDLNALISILTHCQEWGYITKKALESVVGVPSEDTPSKSPAKKKARPSSSMPACRTALFAAPTVEDSGTGLGGLMDFMDGKSEEPSNFADILAAAEESTAKAVETIQQGSLLKKHLSNAVRVANLPLKLFQDHFMFKLNEQLKANGMKEAVFCQVTEPGSALVEFNTVMDASKACLHHLVYESRPLLLHQVTVGDNLLKESAPQAVEENLVDGSSSVGDVGIPCASRTDKPSVELSSSPGIRKFLKACARCKASEPKFVASRGNLLTIAAALTKSNVLGVTVENLSRLHRRLNEKYRNYPETCTFGSEIAYLRGEAGANNPFLGQSDSDECEIENDDGSNWSDNDVLLLISTLTDLKEGYRKVHKDIVFWHKVCKIMKQNKADYTPVQCKKKFSFLKGTFKTYNRQQRGSGNGHIAWPYFTHLEPLLGDDVSVDPSKTYSAGAKNGCTMNEVLAASTSQPETPKERRGRARPVISPEYQNASGAKPSLKQQKVDALKESNAGRAEILVKIAELTAVLKDLKK